MPALHCFVVTPEQTVRETFADAVTVTIYDGELRIGPVHSPMIARLGVGEMRITCADTIERYYVEGGFVEVLNDVVTVLAGHVVPADEINEFLALETIETARTHPFDSLDQVALRDAAVRRARAQLRVARRNTR